MNLEPICCGSCGASLDVPDGVQFVNCRHCGTALKVQRTDSVAFTEVLQTLKMQSDRIAGNTEVLRIQNEISLLDQEWEQRSASLMVGGKHGRVSVPGKFSSIAGGVMATVFGVFWTSAASQAGAPIAGFGVLFIGVGIVMSIVGFVKAHHYQQLQVEHERKRVDLMVRLRRLGQ